MDDSKFYAMVGLAGLLVGYWLATALSTPYKRRRVWRKIKCFFGKHTPGPIRGAPGGRNIQSCDYCLKTLRVYTISKNQAIKDRELIRRIY